MTRDESRAVTFLGVLLCLALVARYINRPKPVVINAGAVDIEALREAGRSLAPKPEPRTKTRKQTVTEVRDTPKEKTPLNINAATEAEIETLPWIGPAMAKRIVARRDSIRRYEKLEDLDAVRGIGPALLKKLQPLISF